MNTDIETALQHLREGKMVLIYDFDDRERETDMVIASQYVTPEIIRTMRKDAGGLICTTLLGRTAEDLGLPFLADVFADAAGKYAAMAGLAPNDIPYDTKSSFSVTINHRETYTGITDNDRALTVSEFAELLGSDIPPDEMRVELGKHFRAPGHVHLLNTSKELLNSRKGHTELSTALLIMAGLTPSATICEMMGDDGEARGKETVRAYAERNGLCFLDGKQVIEAWKRR
jgi:3,4-dihydroxy 2-butanone 4-phosphate synthase